jgi:hypothetical protein
LSAGTWSGPQRGFLLAKADESCIRARSTSALIWRAFDVSATRLDDIPAAAASAKSQKSKGFDDVDHG